MSAAPTPQDFPHGLSCFRLGHDLYAVDLQLVAEINQQLDLTPARTAPEWVAGLVNLRGQIVTVVDLSHRIGLGRGEIGPESRLLVLKSDAELAQCHLGSLSTSPDKIGLLIDAIADVVAPEDDQLEAPPPNLRGVARRLLRGVCKTEEAAIGILDTDPILAAQDQD